MPDYFVQPYDVLFFRGNKSFHFGAWYTEGVFPPFSSTFQGFLRSKILRDSDKDLLDKNGKIVEGKKTIADELIGNDDALTVDITGPYLRDEITQDIFFKTPSDLLKIKKESDIYNSFFNCIGENLETDLDFLISCSNIPNEKFDKLYPPKFISLNKLLEYRISLNNIKLSDKELVLVEDRVLIGLDGEKRMQKNRSVKDEMFCVTQYNRLRNDVGFYCNVVHDNNEIGLKINDGALKFGSESHPVYVQKTSEGNALAEKFIASQKELIDLILKTKKFRIVLLQHGVFENGWFPFDSKINSSTKRINTSKRGLDLELLFASVDNSIKISGYSFEKNKNQADQKGISLKPIINAVPAGSVYLFKIMNECTKENIKNFVEFYDNQKIKNDPYGKMGFNHVMIAVG